MLAAWAVAGPAQAEEYTLIQGGRVAHGGFGGPVVITSGFEVKDYDLADVSPALADPDKDKCLDLVGAKALLFISDYSYYAQRPSEIFSPLPVVTMPRGTSTPNRCRRMNSLPC